MKIGLVGFNTPTGIGTNCRRMFANLPIKRWLVPQHKLMGYGASLSTSGIYKMVGDNWKIVNEFLNGLDVVVSYEKTWPDSLFVKAKQMGIRTVLMCNAEWTSPQDSAFSMADQLIIRTKHGLNHLNSMGLGNKTALVPCPVDINEIIFKQKTIAKRAIFTNGLGGVNGRKGLHVIIEALKISSLPLDVYSISNVSLQLKPFGINPYPQTKTVSELYEHCDIAIQPSLYEGTGLTILDAMAAGLPCITTDSGPMNEYIHAAYGSDADKFLLKSPSFYTVKSGDSDWIAAKSDPKEVVNKVLNLIDTDISQYSLQARKYVEDFHGDTAWSKLLATIIG